MSNPEKQQQPTSKTLLVMIDGWGLSDKDEGNAVLHAKTPRMDWLRENALYTTLDASGNAVGLPEGVMGNSEVGHLTAGAGQAQYQDLVRIDLSVKKDTLKENTILKETFARAKAGNGRLHFLGLLSDAGIHSHNSHLYYLMNAAKEAEVSEVYIHAFSDGRDTPPTSGVTYVEDLFQKCRTLGCGKLSTVMGRFYAMDRDKRWERIDTATQGLVQGVGDKVDEDGVIPLMKKRYEDGMTDEFMTPIIVNEKGTIREGDTLLFFDFRADRMREIVAYMGSEFMDPPPFDFQTEAPKSLYLVQMTQYKADYPFPIVFPQQKVVNVVAEWLSKLGVKQYHVAETEKYAHVTFFFNGGREDPFPMEDRLVIPSPKVATYDLAPEMSMQGVADAVCEGIRKQEYGFVLCNLASPDMVGHTGDYEKAIIAVEACDRVIGQMYDTCIEQGYTILVTSDHGNAEVMKRPDGSPVTSHTTNRVPFVIAGKDTVKGELKADGTLGDVAPTLLTLAGLPIPQEMTGRVLL